MKSVLVIQNSPSVLFDSIHDFQRQHKSEVHVIPCTYDEFSFDICLEKQLVFFRDNPLDCHAIYFKSSVDQFYLASTLALYCERQAIPFVNSSNISRVSSGKLFQMLAFVYADMRIPHTVFFHRKRLQEAFVQKYIENCFPYPFIMKSVSGAKGEDNYLVHTWREIPHVLAGSRDSIQYIFQEFIPNKSDYRLLTLNHEVKAAYERIRSDDNTHLNNLSQGARVKAVDIQAIPHLIKMAQTASNVVQKEVCGVDILISQETHDPYILEANPNPGLAGPGAMDQMMLFLQKLPSVLFPSTYTANTSTLHQKAQQISTYFNEHKDLLGDKYFHFLTRMYLWTGDRTYRKMLDHEKISQNYRSASSFKKYLNTINSRQTVPHKHLERVQNPFLGKYPNLFRISQILSATRIASTIFNKDYRDCVYELYSDHELNTLCQSLLHDLPALYAFSTSSINVLYNYFVFMKETNGLFDVRALGMGALKFTKHPSYEFLHQRAYIITHMIIGESQFYTRSIPVDVIKQYVALLKELEKRIAQYYCTYKLDIKLEFLVCARILNYTSYLEDVIYSEALHSFSPTGGYIVDTHNSSSALQRHDVYGSEHRSTLFIMSTTPYSFLK